MTGLSVTISIDRPVVPPGATATVEVIALLPDRERLTDFRFRIHAFGQDEVTELPIVGPGSHGYQITLNIPRLPIEAEVTMDAVARIGSETDSVRKVFRVGDDGPPRLSIETAHVVDPPDSLLVSWLAVDSATLDSVAIRVRGAIQYDTVVHGDTAGAVAMAGLVRLWVPPEIALGDSVTIEAEVTDLYGKTTAQRRVVPVRDASYPVLAVSVDSVLHPELDPRPRRVFFPGDTMRLRIRASDNRKLTRIGYRWMGIGDSVPAAGTTDSAAFTYVVPPGMSAEDARIDAFADDSSGNRSVTGPSATVVDGVFRSFVTVDNPDAVIQSDMRGGAVLDARRDRLYFTTWANRVDVMSLSPLGSLPAFAAGSSVRAIDLSPGGDSLIALVNRDGAQPNRLVIWHLDGGPGPIATIPVTMLGSCDAWDVKVAANGHALVTGYNTCPTVDVNLRTGAQRQRRSFNEVRNLDGSGDHRTILQWDTFGAAIYRSDSDSLGPVMPLFPNIGVDDRNPGPALDHAGRHILVRNRLYDSTLTSYRPLLPDPGQLPPPRTLSADGNTAFIGHWSGYWRVDVATGDVAERVILPRGTGRLVAHPDGQRLIVVGWGWIGIVDLQ